jgi:anti-sigma regulatory factor (Ser/Thr protein kinase)
VALDLNLALEELFTNAVRHGGCEGMEEAVEVRLRAALDGVRVEFRDRGRPFDPAMVPAPDLRAPLETRRAGGLGIHLVRAIMRDIRYQRAGEWNRITMRLRPQ